MAKKGTTTVQLLSFLCLQHTCCHCFNCILEVCNLGTTKIVRLHCTHICLSLKIHVVPTWILKIIWRLYCQSHVQKCTVPYNLVHILKFWKMHGTVHFVQYRTFWCIYCSFAQYTNTYTFIQYLHIHTHIHRHIHTIHTIHIHIHTYNTHTHTHTIHTHRYIHLYIQYKQIF